MGNKKNLALMLVVFLLGVLYCFVDRSYLSLNFYKLLCENNFTLSFLVFFLVYLVCTTLSLPGAFILTFIASGVFGFWPALLLVSFTSAMGATLAFLLSRNLFRDWVLNRYADKLHKINQGVAQQGNLYLFSLRLIPVIPFAVINLAMGLTAMRTWNFYWVSQLGMLPGIALYVNAGAQFGKINPLSMEQIFTPSILISFVALAVVPWFVVRLVHGVKKSKGQKFTP